MFAVGTAFKKAEYSPSVSEDVFVPVSSSVHWEAAGSGSVSGKLYKLIKSLRAEAEQPEDIKREIRKCILYKNMIQFNPNQ